MQRFFNDVAAGIIVVGLAFGTGGALAMGGGGGGGGGPLPQKSTYAMAVEKVKAHDYSSAIRLLQDVVAKEPSNADALNYLGFSYRESGDLKSAMTYYQRALAVDPNHKGANEYLGELYVKMGDLPRAEQQLAKLDRICTFGCAEYEELKHKVADLKRRHGS
jgi:predicted Zn-dependent protease